MYKAAVSNKKGVVGSPGTKIPKTPKANELEPKRIINNFANLFISTKIAIRRQKYK